MYIVDDIFDSTDAKQRKLKLGFRINGKWEQYEIGARLALKWINALQCRKREIEEFDNQNSNSREESRELK